MRRTRLARLLLFVLLAPLMLFVAPPAFAASHTVAISHSAFSPSSMSVQVGDTVTWTNSDTPPHDVTVTSGPVTFTSPMLTTGQSWSYTVRTAGSYSYICSIHPYMRATLTVTAPLAAAVAAGASPRPPAAPAAAGAPAALQAAAPQPAAPLPATAVLQQQTVAPVAASTSPKNVNANLLIAGLVVGVATLCLLLLGSSALAGQATAARQPSQATADHRE